MNARTVVQLHINRERIDVLIAVILPFILMSVSGYANAWAFAGGHLDFSQPNSWIALIRGVFLEGLIYACFKLAKIFFLKRNLGGAAASFILLCVGMIGMVVSAGCNLGWETSSGEMTTVMVIVAQYMPGFLATLFKVGLGLLFPVAVGVLALFDVTNLVEDMLKSSHLDNKAVRVHRSEMHRTAYLKSQKKQGGEISDRYDTICAADATNMVSAVQRGDLSFGADDLALPPQKSSVIPATKVIPANTPFPQLAPPSLAQRQGGQMPQAGYPNMPVPSLNTQASPALLNRQQPVQGN